MGADLRLDPSGFDIGIRSSWEEAMQEVRDAGGTPYGIPVAGLVDLVRDGDIPRDATVLYAHLGGQPALNAYSGIF